jgi:hypothetical protein
MSDQNKKADPQAPYDDLSGFKDVMDLLHPSKQKKNKERLLLHESFEIVSYLEQEEKRIKNITNLYEEKFEIWTEMNQFESLTKKQEEACLKLRSLIARELAGPHSPIQENMRFLWDQCFKKN